MRRLRSILAVGAALAAFAPGVTAQTTIIPLGTYTGGSSFDTSLSAALSYTGDATNGYIVDLRIADHFGPGVLAAIGLVNVPTGVSVVAGTAPSGWQWMGTNQLTGAGMPRNIFAWTSPPPDPFTGVDPLDTPPAPDGWHFTFRVTNVTTTQLANMGFGVHAIAYMGCSTKFAVWDGGQSTNDKPGDGSGGCISVPEPSSLLLLGSGFAGMAFVASRRRKNEIVDEDGNDIEI